MAGGPLGLHDEQQRVAVAVGAHLAHASRLPEVSPFCQSTPRLRLQKWAKPVSAVRSQGLRVGVGHHQHVAARAVLDHDRHQARSSSNDEPRDSAELSNAHLDAGRAQLRLGLADPHLARSGRATPPAPRSPRPRSAPPPCARRDPQPPEATTGTRTASATARVRATSKPSFVPSRSMLVSRISPAPRSAPSRAHATASVPVGVRPPCTKTSQPPVPAARASMASTTACAPKRRASRSSRSGRSRRPCSPPPCRRRRAAARRRPPPSARRRPTVNGRKTASATRRTISSDDRARVRGGRDVEEHQLVGPLGVVARRALHRVARRRAARRT